MMIARVTPEEIQRRPAPECSRDVRTGSGPCPEAVQLLKIAIHRSTSHSMTVDPSHQGEGDGEIVTECMLGGHAQSRPVRWIHQDGWYREFRRVGWADR